MSGDALDPERTIVTRGAGDEKTLPLRAGVSLDELPRIVLGSDLVEVGLLGEGGMGRILLAHQTSLDRDVAVKTLRPRASVSDMEALVREGQISGALEHPSIVPVHALGIDEDGQPLLVMKRVEGVSWRTLLEDDTHAAWTTHLGTPRALLEANLDVLTAVCRALELAHTRKILHLDVKPENVMLGPFGEVYLVDWGIATMSNTARTDGAVVGTPSYLAPEMARCELVDERTDVYLLGATLHRVLTGRPRHTGATVAEVIVVAARSEPATYGQNIPAPLAELCNAACGREPAERPPSVRAFRELLTAYRRNRNALAICATGGSRLGELDRLLSASDGPPKDLALAYRLSAEARFAFAQSLEQFPEYEAARAGAVRCVEVLVDLELRQGHIETAAALLEEEPAARRLLLGRLEAAREQARARAEEHERLRVLDEQSDPTVGRKARTFAIVCILASTTAIAIDVARRTAGAARFDGYDLTTYMVVTVVVSSVASLLARRMLFANAFAFRLAALTLVAELALLANRAAGASHGRPIVETLATDLLIVATCTAIAAIVFSPRLVPGLLVALAGFVGIGDVPAAWTVLFFSAVIMAHLALSAWAMWTQRQK